MEPWKALGIKPILKIKIMIIIIVIMLKKGQNQNVKNVGKILKKTGIKIIQNMTAPNLYIRISGCQMNTVKDSQYEKIGKYRI
jgi:hypothetical protein